VYRSFSTVAVPHSDSFPDETELPTSCLYVQLRQSHNRNLRGPKRAHCFPDANDKNEQNKSASHLKHLEKADLFAAEIPDSSQSKEFSVNAENA